MDNLPEYLNGLFHRHHDTFLADESLSDMEVFLLGIILIEGDAGKAGAAVNDVKRRFVSFGRKERPNFGVTIHNARKNRLIDDKNGTLTLLVKGLKKIQPLCQNSNAFQNYIPSAVPDEVTKTSGELVRPQPGSNGIVARQIDFVILTALEEERDAVLRKLPGYRRVPPTSDDIRVYYEAEVSSDHADGFRRVYRLVILCLLNMGRVEAANATGDAIRRWHPRYVLLVGIAGGVRENGVKLGDIIVSNQIVDYELQKLTSEGSSVRYIVHQADARLVGAAQNFIGDQWLKLVVQKRPGKGTPQRLIGPVATGDKVVAVNDVLANYSDDWPKLLGIEMEAGGAASASFQTDYRPGFFMVRGISDLANNKKDTSKVKAWRSYASDIAAAYTIALLESGPIPD